MKRCKKFTYWNFIKTNRIIIAYALFQIVLITAIVICKIQEIKQ